MTKQTRVPLLLTLVLAVYAHARSEQCNVRARTDAGWVCGLQRQADDGSLYASFRGVPYAKQPLGELRFKDLEPLEPWDGFYDASEEGPVCFQTDILYGRIMQPRSMGEDCIHANIHVPIEALPYSALRAARELKPPRETGTIDEPADEDVLTGGLPILVFIHGGGFAFGSGDSDLLGPEYLVSKKVIVITFNYRLNVFGFLSLNTSRIPGNAGLRDMVTLLRWVQKNARAFGGDPDNVTVGGQSAGAVATHLLTMSKAAEGLFKRGIMMSGTAISNFYSPSPDYAKLLSSQLLTVLSINATDPEDVYKELVNLPAEKLHAANHFLIDQIGLTTFGPTVETPFPGVTTILDENPDVLLANGRDKGIPLLVGYTSSECETFRKRLTNFDIVQKSKENIIILVPPKNIFTTPPSNLPDVVKKLDNRYYNGNVTLDAFIQYCTDGFFEYSVLKLVEEHYKADAPVYVYRFSYESNNTAFKIVDNLSYRGAGHVDDQTYVFKVNSVIGSRRSYPSMTSDDYMKNFMTNYFVSFMKCGKPICDKNERFWPAASRGQFLYENIYAPDVYQVHAISSKQQQIVKFFDSLSNVQ